MGRERDRGGGGLAAGVAFPMVADFAAFDEFRHQRSHHPIAAMRAARRRGKGAQLSESGRIGMELHGLGLQ